MSGISSDVIRGYNDTMILYLLLDGPSYGYEISRRIRQLSEEKYVIKETTLYSAFSRMEKNGLLESFSQFAENGKRRTYYRITPQGRGYYGERCEEWRLTKEVVSRFIIDGDPYSWHLGSYGKSAPVKQGGMEPGGTGSDTKTKDGICLEKAPLQDHSGGICLEKS